QMIGGGPGVVGSGLSVPAIPTAPREPMMLGELNPPPLVESEADLQAAYQWLLAERRRLESYTRVQFQRLQNEHQTLLSQSYSNEQRLVSSFQELSRQKEFLAHQTKILQRRGQELGEGETTLAQQMQHVCTLQSNLDQMQETSATVKRDVDTERQLLESLRTESAALQRAKESARQDLETVECALREHQAA